MKRAHASFAIALALAARAHAWDAGGHMLVDQIAWTLMKPEARARATELVRNLENTYNNGQPYNFITAGAWMDDMRSKKGYAWSKWHYVNVDWTADGAAFTLPEPPHVVWAIEESLKTLNAPGTPPAKASETLAMIMHLVADVHQPMHATDRGDRGGNGVLITGVPFSDLWPGTVANLHAFWDKAFRFDKVDGKIVEVWKCPDVPGRPTNPVEGIIAEQAERIRKKYLPRHPAAEVPQLGPVEWAKESHRLGCLFGYPAGFEPSDHQVVALTPEFVEASRTIAEDQIAIAGYHLARVLNEALAP